VISVDVSILYTFYYYVCSRAYVLYNIITVQVGYFGLVSELVLFVIKNIKYVNTIRNILYLN